MQEGVKFDKDKLRYDLVPFGAVDKIARVFTYGATKYSPWNWLHLEEVRLLAAAFRHLSKHAQGEELDPESGYSHLSHAATTIIMLMHRRG